MTKKNLLIGAALTGMFALAACSSTEEKKDEAAPAAPVVATGECHGINACKGKGECGGKGHGCAGKNTCKGKGWTKMTKADCEAKKGEFKGG